MVADACDVLLKVGPLGEILLARFPPRAPKSLPQESVMKRGHRGGESEKD